jgi:hypothetical protein
MTMQPYAPPQQLAPQQLPPVPAARPQGLSWLIHGNPKAGKSNLGDSGPLPSLTLDVEGSSFWTTRRKISWNPMRESPPHPERRITVGYGRTSVTASWETCLVLARDARTVTETYRVLNTGQHPFSSLCMDSVTEVQQRIIDDLTAGKPMDRDKWGALLRQVNSMIRSYRDLVTHPVHPLWSVCFVAGTHLDDRTKKWRPMLQGQAADYAPYYVDVLGYLGAMPDGSRQLLIGPHPLYETGERVGGRLPYALQIGYQDRPGYSLTTALQQVHSGGR